MIAKELDPFFGTSPMDFAGRQAEEQMAFYLRRRFHDWPDVFVINGLRFEVGGMFTQIDHLLVSLYGFQVIESKSVSTEVSVNERGEWQRQFDGVWRGMASPEEQAKEQLRTLVNLLCAHSAQLTGKMLGLIQKQYGGYARQAYVAISNNGIVHRSNADSSPLVLKADQLAGRLGDEITQWRTDSSLITMFKPHKTPLLRMPEKELRPVVEFLLSQHQPVQHEGPRLPAMPMLELPLVIDVPAVIANEAVKPAPDARPARYFCAQCQGAVSFAVARFCWTNKTKFGGQVFCMTHQKSRGA
jgi:hypothetical protein